MQDLSDNPFDGALHPLDDSLAALACLPSLQVRQRLPLCSLGIVESFDITLQVVW